MTKEQIAEKRYPRAADVRQHYFTEAVQIIKQEAFISGWEASEVDTIGFIEWVAQSNWCYKYENEFWVLFLNHDKKLTTAQLLELYREEIKNKSPNTK